MSIVTGYQATTLISTCWILDERLSCKALGILIRICACPVGQEMPIASLESGSDGKAAIRTGLDELKKYGYLRQAQGRDGFLLCDPWTPGDGDGEAGK